MCNSETCKRKQARAQKQDRFFAVVLAVLVVIDTVFIVLTSNSVSYWLIDIALSALLISMLYTGWFKNPKKIS